MAALTYAQALAVAQNLPSLIAGTNARKREVSRKFWSIVVQELFKKMHKSYRERTTGGSDDLHDAWAPLDPKTIERKKKQRKVGSAILPPSKHPRWINYDQGRLMASYKPGKIIASFYVPYNLDQYVRIDLTSGKVKLSSRVSYAKRVSKQRKLFPGNHAAWVRDAIAVAVKKMEKELTKP